MFVAAEKKVILNGPVMNIMVYGCILLISWVGANMIVSDTLTTGELMSLLTFCMNILSSLMMISMIFVMLSMSVASAERVTEVICEEPGIKNPENPVMEVKDGSITFKDVSFSYQSGSGEPVLKDIDLEIKSGETIGIIGGTGSAKSSLVNLISRLYDVKDGSVCVGGVDVRKYDLEPKELRLVQGKADKKPKLFLLKGKKGGKEGYLEVLPTLIIENEDGSFTEEMNEIYGCYQQNAGRQKNG